jgi:uncharacterized protein (TIGR03083 family)
MDLNDEELLTLALDSAASNVDAMPPKLWNRVSAATASDDVGAGGSTVVRRHAGWSVTDPSGITPLDAFVQTASEFGQVLDSLGTADWQKRTRLEGRPVRHLVEHLVGMERYVLGQLGRAEPLSADRREDHWPVTWDAARDMADLADEEVAGAWWREVLALISACAELGPEYPLRYHHLAGGVRGLLVSRTFELWAHGDDIRQAVGQPLDLLDEPRLTLMVRELMNALPFGVALTGSSLPGQTARFDLSGPGGGTFDVPLDLSGPAGVPDIVITTDVIALCRLAANRLATDDLGADVNGDQGLLQPVLAAAGAFAAD